MSVLTSIIGNVDHAPRPAIRIFVGQRQCEINRAGNRSAGALANRRLHDRGGHCICRFRPVDQRPGYNDLLVIRCGPLEIGHGQPSVRTGLQRLEELLGDDRLRITFALNGKFIDIHRIGNINGNNEFDINRRQADVLDRLILEILSGSAGDLA